MESGCGLSICDLPIDLFNIHIRLVVACVCMIYRSVSAGQPIVDDVTFHRLGGHIH